MHLTQLSMLSVSAAVALTATGLFVYLNLRAQPQTTGDRSGRSWVLLTALLTAYSAAAVFGLNWAAVQGAGSPVWPAAGIGLAGLLLCGIRLWPAILVGRLTATMFVGAEQHVLGDLLIATGNAGATVLAAAPLLRRFPIERRLSAVGDVLRLTLAALVLGAVAALVGTAVLAISVDLPAYAAVKIGLLWWLGTSAGALLIAPPILVWSYRAAWQLSWQRWTTLVALLAATGAISYGIFFDEVLGPFRTWLVYPILIWIAITYEVRGASLGVLIVTAAVTWSTSVGVGSFTGVGETLFGHVTLAQQFTIVTAFAALVLGAAADQRRGLEALHRMEARESSIVETAVDPIIIIDDRATIVAFNPAAEQAFGYSAGEVLGQNVKILMPEPYRTEHDGYMERYHRTGERRIIGIGRQVEGRRKDGSVFPLDLSVAEWRAEESTFYTGVIHDQSERVAAEAALRKSEHRLATAIQASGGGSYEQELAAGELYVSAEWLAILGYDELPVRPERFDEWLADQVHPDDREFRAEAWLAFLEGREARYSAELRKRHASGKWVWVRSFAQATERDPGGAVRRLTGMMLDISERKAAEVQVHHLAQHDALTGISNRTLFAQRLAEATAQADAAQARAGLIMIDLDHFKEINDTMGHPIGDAVLRIVTDRITSYIRTGDTAARLGGDEFAVVAPGAHARADIEELAHRLHRAFAHPAQVDGTEIPLAASVGFAVYPDDAETVDMLMRHADLALYEAKRQGRDEVRAFRPQLAAAATRRSQIESQLRRAIDGNELALHYQPQFDLRTGRVDTVEALVRWERDGEPIEPGEFIPVAERSGVIRALGAWVLGEAIRQQATWREAGHNISVAINVSPAEASAESFLPMLKRLLGEAGVAGDAIELEITEGLLIDPDKPSVQAYFATCEDEGISLAIDDFGIGYSSLNYLASLPISKIKIDRSFISRMDQHRHAALVRAVVSLGRDLEKRVVAEGVETQAQLESLRRMGCDGAQGYFLCKPVPAEGISHLLETELEADRPRLRLF